MIQPRYLIPCPQHASASLLTWSWLYMGAVSGLTGGRARPLGRWGRQRGFCLTWSAGPTLSCWPAIVSRINTIPVSALGSGFFISTVSLLKRKYSKIFFDHGRMCLMKVFCWGENQPFSKSQDKGNTLGGAQVGSQRGVRRTPSLFLYYYLLIVGSFSIQQV